MMNTLIDKSLSIFQLFHQVIFLEMYLMVNHCPQTWDFQNKNHTDVVFRSIQI